MVEEKQQKKAGIEGPLLGLGICICLFVGAVIAAFFSMFIGPWGGGSSSPLLELSLVVPVLGFVACLVWLAAVLVQRRSEK